MAGCSRNEEWGKKVHVCRIITLYRHLGHSEEVNNELITVTSFVIGMWKLVCNASVFDHMNMHNHVLCTYAVGITLSLSATSVPLDLCSIREVVYYNECAHL